MTTEKNKNKISKGVIFLYIESISLLFSGYLFWLILSKITSPAIIGTSSTIISFSALFTAIAAIGISSGIQRFLSKSIESNRIEESRGIINSALLFITLGISITIVLVTIFNSSIQASFGIEQDFIGLAMAIMTMTVISNLIRYFIIASLQTSSIALASVLSTIIKIVITVILVTTGHGVIGILIGYLTYFIASSIVLTVTLKRTIYKKYISDTNYSIFEKFQKPIEIFKTSIPFWFPNIINTAGNQLGTVAIFVSAGASNAGIYFISLSIYTGISLIMSVLSTIAYPTISSLTDGRKRAASKFVTITCVFTIPLSVFIIGYPIEILYIFGEGYIMGAPILQVLFLSILPVIITTGTSILAYAYGNNKQVLMIGFSSSIPKIFLYFLLVPLSGPIGAALSFLIGSLIGFGFSIYTGRKIRINYKWKNVFLILIIPIIIIIIFKFIELNFIFGLVGTLGISFIAFLKLKIISSVEFEEPLKMLPKKISNPLINILKKI